MIALAVASVEEMGWPAVRACTVGSWAVRLPFAALTASCAVAVETGVYYGLYHSEMFAENSFEGAEQMAAVAEQIGLSEKFVAEAVFAVVCTAEASSDSFDHASAAVFVHQPVLLAGSYLARYAFAVAAAVAALFFHF